MGRRGERRKFAAAGGEFSQGEFISPENLKERGPHKAGGLRGEGFSVVNVGDDGKIVNFGLIGHRFETSVDGAYLLCLAFISPFMRSPAP